MNLKFYRSLRANAQIFLSEQITKTDAGMDLFYCRYPWQVNKGIPYAQEVVGNGEYWLNLPKKQRFVEVAGKHMKHDSPKGYGMLEI